MEADLKIGYINVKSYKTSELQVCFHLYANIIDWTLYYGVCNNNIQISDMALCVAFALGPLTGGAIIESLNFEYLLLICGIINLGGFSNR